MVLPPIFLEGDAKYSSLLWEIKKRREYPSLTLDFSEVREGCSPQIAIFIEEATVGRSLQSHSTGNGKE